MKAEGFDDSVVKKINTFITRLSYLVHLGCRPYELVEYPRILLLTESEVNQRVEKLRSAISVDGISVSLLKFAAPNKHNWLVKNKVMNYLRPLSGNLNRVDEIVEELNCSDLKMMEILTRNPRLVGKHYRKDVTEKIRCLISHGARHEDLYQNTNLLNNKTLAAIQFRAEQLSKIGWIPLPLGIIGREDTVFEKVVEQYAAAHRDSVTDQQVASVDSVIRLLPPMSANRTAVIRPKIEYLLSEGYAATDIVNCQQTLERSLKKLKMTISELKPYHMQCVDLAVVNHYALSRRILSSRRCKFRNVVARVIGCSRSALAPLPKDRSLYAVRDIEYMVAVNADYLRDQLRFTAEDLASVPLVLAHVPDIVRRHWDVLNSVDDDDDQAELSRGSRQAKLLFRRHANNRRLRLNLLQYCIEKEANFSHACVSSWTEDSDAEFNVTETASSAVADCDSDADADELDFHDDSDAQGVCTLVDKLDAVDRSDDDVNPLSISS